jgi:osomolarity two-component system response regulator SKN7
MSPVEELLSKLIRKVKLLYVEDEEAIATTLRNALYAKYECSVDIANNGEEAICYLNHTKYDLILLDLVLKPSASGVHMSGVDVFRYIKKVTPATPVVVVTGHFGSDLASEASKCGVISFIHKPFTINDFDSVFNLFKVRARTKEDENFFKLKGCVTSNGGAIPA